MTAVKQLRLVPVDDYLAGELASPAKHEYVAGVVYAMAGAANVHNRVATNLTGMLYNRLRNQPCQPYNSDTKIRVRLPTHVRFYYPDASVVCRPNPPDDSFHDEPVVVVEAVSESTRRVDGGEKKDTYLTIGSLALYVLVETGIAAAVVHRRTENGFVREVYQGLDSAVPMPEIGTTLPLAEVYEGVRLDPEPPDGPAG